MSERERKMEPGNDAKVKMSRRTNKNLRHTYCHFYIFYTLLRCESTLDRLDIYINDS